MTLTESSFPLMKAVRLSGDFFYSHFFRSRSEWFDIAVVAQSSDSRRESSLFGIFSLNSSLYGYIAFLRRADVAQSPNIIALARARLGGIKPKTGRIFHFHF